MHGARQRFSARRSPRRLRHGIRRRGAPRTLRRAFPRDRGIQVWARPQELSREKGGTRSHRPPPPPGFALHDTAHPSRVPPRRAERELSFQSDGALVTPSPLVHLPTSRGQSFPSLEFLLECAPGVLPAQCLRDRHPTPSRADELLGLSDKESSPALSRTGSPSAAPEWAQAPLGVGPLLDKRRRPAGFEAGAPRSVLAGVGTGAGRAKTGRVATAGRAEGVGARRGCGAPDVSLVHAGVDIAQLFRADLARARAAEASGAEASDADGATGLAPARGWSPGGARWGARGTSAATIARQSALPLVLARAAAAAAARTRRMVPSPGQWRAEDRPRARALRLPAESLGPWGRATTGTRQKSAPMRLGGVGWR